MGTESITYEPTVEMTHTITPHIALKEMTLKDSVISRLQGYNLGITWNHVVL